MRNKTLITLCTILLSICFLLITISLKAQTQKQQQQQKKEQMEAELAFKETLSILSEAKKTTEEIKKLEAILDMPVEKDKLEAILDMPVENKIKALKERVKNLLTQATDKSNFFKSRFTSYNKMSEMLSTQLRDINNGLDLGEATKVTPQLTTPGTPQPSPQVNPAIKAEIDRLQIQINKSSEEIKRLEEKLPNAQTQEKAQILKRIAELKAINSKMEQSIKELEKKLGG